MPQPVNPPRRNGLSRDDIRQAAVVAFSEKGYRGTNLQDVASVLGVTRQAIYYYYSNKHALLLEMFEEYFSDLDRALDEALEGVEDPRLRFEAMLRAHVLTVARTPELSSIFTREYEALEPEARTSVRQRRRAYQRRFVDGFDTMGASGEAREMPASAVVSLMFGAANWTFRWYDHRRHEMSPEELADLVMSLFRSGYALPAPC
jgi:AcrR family transcriptional regulator